MVTVNGWAETSCQIKLILIQLASGFRWGIKPYLKTSAPSFSSSPASPDLFIDLPWRKTSEYPEPGKILPSQSAALHQCGPSIRNISIKHGFAWLNL